MNKNLDFVNKEVNQLWDNFGAKAQKELFTCLDGSLQELSQFIVGYKELHKNLNNTEQKEINRFANLCEFKSGILNLLLENQKEINEDDFKDFLEGYLNAIDSILQETKKNIRKKEIFTPYSISRNGKLFVLIKKLRLNVNFAFKYQSRRAINVLRSLLKLNPLELQSTRYRKIPYQSIVKYYLGVQLPKAILSSFHRLMEVKSNVFLDFWKLEDDFDTEIQNNLLENKDENLSETINLYISNEIFEEQKKLLSQAKRWLKKEIESATISVFKELDKAISVADTPDLPIVHFKNSKIEAQQNLVFTNLNLEKLKWVNTHKTLLDDWLLDVEIVLLYFTVLDNYKNLDSKITHFIDEHLSLNLEQLREFILSSANRITSTSNTAKDLLVILDEERQKVGSELIDKLLAETANKLSGSINKDLEKFNSQTIALVENISNKRSFIKGHNYERGVRNAEINWLSPRELLNFEALPHFQESINNIKQFIEISLKKARLKLNTMGTVCDFSLESAQMMLQKKKGAVKTTMKVSEEGYSRALGHLDEVLDLLETIKKEPQENLHLVITNFNSEIQKLKNTETIIELNLKIVRIKAMERSKKIQQDVVAFVKNMVPRLIALIKGHLSDTPEIVTKIKKRLGITSEEVKISHELTEFIHKTELSLKKLPFIYQRLYQLTPTDETRFFVHRQIELDSLQQAFDDWEKDRFVTTAVVAEKGNGVTSLFNIFLKNIETDIPVIHQSPEKKIYTPQQYLSFFAQLFEQDNFESNEHIIEYLNNKDDNLILILENLHHFYLKKVNGFECQKMLFELISNTSKKVFWIGSYTIHSWEYLKKTVKVSENFTREIQIKKFSSDMLDEVIFKRNILSGYKIQFEASSENGNSSSFQKMNEDEKQKYLRKQFFIELAQISNGNVSLAQLYWLRSTRGVSDDTINIGSLREIDVSFVKDLPSEYLFAMHTILTHDGLTLEDYSTTLNLPVNNCRNVLIQMLEKGLLIRPKEKFNINPIIFRQVVSLLRSHNFIN
ncbi:hypothetical protein [Marinifilum fragile]|uniref:hypothetical protein n=1 Tax=Marinifilum fragile TaxID=570161 RepID=UPI002AA7896C|nr:hypothetical protein [Marinifilum fragile]